MQTFRPEARSTSPYCIATWRPQDSGKTAFDTCRLLAIQAWDAPACRVLHASAGHRMAQHSCRGRAAHLEAQPCQPQPHTAPDEPLCTTCSHACPSLSSPLHLMKMICNITASAFQAKSMAVKGRRTSSGHPPNDQAHCASAKYDDQDNNDGPPDLPSEVSMELTGCSAIGILLEAVFPHA